MARNTPPRFAMTAIEVLAATILASLMLASVMGVLGGLTRQQRSLMASKVDNAWHQRLSEQLSWDLLNAREYAASAAGVRLIGFAGRDFANGRPTGRPTIVEYYLQSVGSDCYLVRREEHTDARTNDNWRAEVAGRGVHHFEFGSTSVVQAIEDRPAMSSWNAAQNVPDRVLFRIFGTENNLPEYEKQFVLR